jgi:hypothetical protein
MFSFHQNLHRSSTRLSSLSVSLSPLVSFAPSFLLFQPVGPVPDRRADQGLVPLRAGAAPARGAAARRQAQGEETRRRNYRAYILSFSLLAFVQFRERPALLRGPQRLDTSFPFTFSFHFSMNRAAPCTAEKRSCVWTSRAAVPFTRSSTPPRPPSPSGASRERRGTSCPSRAVRFPWSAWRVSTKREGR